MLDGVERVIAQAPADVKIIPGHGRVSNLDHGKASLAVAEGDPQPDRDGDPEGETLDRMRQAQSREPREKYSGDFVNQDVLLETLYNSLTGQKNGMFIKHD